MELAVEISRASKPSWNPLKCSGTELPVPVLLMAKLVALCFLLSMEWRSLPDPFLPFVPLLGHFGSGALFRWGLKALFLGASAALLLNRRVRWASLLAGSAVLLGVLSSRVYFQNNRTYAGCLLFLAGLTESTGAPWLLRLQIVLVYFGAGLNKLLDAGWRTGAFFAAWAPRFVKDATFQRIAAWFPGMTVPLVMSWTTIAGELGLSVTLLIRRLRTAALWFGMLFHTMLTFLTFRGFGVFYYSLLASYLAFVDWPKSRITVLYDGDCGFCDATRRWIERFDLEGIARWTPYQATECRYGITEDALAKRVHVVVDGKIYAGFSAFKMLMLYNPVVYFALAVIFALPSAVSPDFTYRRWMALALWCVFAPIFTPIGERVYMLIANNRHRMPGKRTCKLPAA